MFAFGDTYTVRTRKDGKEIGFKVRRGTDTPLALDALVTKDRGGHGTSLESHQPRMTGLTAKNARAEVGMRFLMDPSFSVFVDGEKVDFDDLPSKQIDRIEVDAGAAGTVSILVIDTRDSDRTSQQHGVAWHVNGRLVGKCSWEGTGHDRFLDGRRSEAKRYTFIVEADRLSDAVEKDWSRFERDNPLFKETNEKVQDAIRQKLFELTSEKRSATVQSVRDTLESSVAKLSPLSRERWTSFVDEALVACPSISEKELTQLADVLAKLEDT
ncbi:MAG: ATP-binding protein, partial [Gemmatimonadaceae bacterium]